MIRNSNDCLNDVKGRNFLVLRGYIYGRIRVQSQRYQHASASAKVSKVEGLEIKYTSQGDISLEESESRPRFAIVSQASLAKDCADCRIGLAAITEDEMSDAVEVIASARDDYYKGSLASLNVSAIPAYADYIVGGRNHPLISVETDAYFLFEAGPAILVAFDLKIGQDACLALDLMYIRFISTAHETLLNYVVNEPSRAIV